MHILRTELKSLDESAEAVDLDQSRADIVVLSFSDSDLSVVAKAWEKLRADGLAEGLSLRLASLGDLKHPYSVDLYAEKVLAHARVVIVRLLGGLDYWRYGAEEVARLARGAGATLACVPGDHREDPRLDALSTAPIEDTRRLWRWFQAGGERNAEQALRYAIAKLGVACLFEAPQAQAAFGEYVEARRAAHGSRALIVFYRAAWLAGDTAPYSALSQALAGKGFEVRAVFVTSLKDPEAASNLQGLLATYRPDLILNATSFSARGEDGATPFDVCDAPVLQVGVSLATEAQWQAASRGLSPSDIAMNVALPEVDGRVFAGAISFKAQTPRIDALEFAPLRSEPDVANVEHAAELAAAWATLRRQANPKKRLALVLSDYPAKGGRAGYAVGLDTFASVTEMARRLSAEGYDVGDDFPAVEELPRRLAQRRATGLALADYRNGLTKLSPEFAASLRERWGEPEDDPDFANGRFQFGFARFGAVLVALQPDRGAPDHRKADYHDTALPPRHGFVAFYLWLREIERVHAIVHCGAHGTLEWLPGKAVALSSHCAPRAVLGAVPLIYPFIVSNPGEATPAKRRVAGVTIGHLTPPLVSAEAHGAVAELEGLLDEYAQAQTLDPRRARRIAELLLDRARATGMAGEAGIAETADLDEALVRLDAWLCDIKDMRIGDGLHVFGRALNAERQAASVRSIAEAASQDEARVADLLERSPSAEMDALVQALSGRRIEAGPGGAPARGRLDVLPTGRNLFSVDPRAIPTRTAWDLGQKAAAEFLARYAQDHGDWPRCVVFDVWGSAAMRTGGEELAQAMALIGVRPVWDSASHRVSGFEVLPPALLGRPRVDVTLRISGLFRDVFPAQIALFQAAVAAVAERRDEAGEDNPLAEAIRGGGSVSRIFGAAPGAYGVGLARRALGDDGSAREELGAEYLAATSHAYEGERSFASKEFSERVAEAQALVHVQDLPGQDVLDSDAFAEHEGGFAAAAAALGGRAAIYHLDVTNPAAPRVRSLQQEIARALRGRAANPRWIRGQMRHGYRGAAEIAESVDNLFVFAATTDLVSDALFDLLFEAVCGDGEVRDFLRDANPDAASAIARRFDEALRRGLWRSRRNSLGKILSQMQEAA